MINLLEWQSEALNSFIQHNYNGIVEAGTGTGKTILGISCILLDIQKEKIWIVVHTEQLMFQWKSEIEKYIKNEEIGLIGGGIKNEKRITVAIINSVRNYFKIMNGFLIVDEVHHLPSDKNIKLIIKNNFNKFLGLTATLIRSDEKHIVLMDTLGTSVIYSYSQKNAIKDGLLSKFIIINKSIELTLDERIKYNNLDIIIKNLINEFGGLYNLIRLSKKNMRAANGMRAIQKRKEIVINAKNKLNKTIKILSEVNYKKAIIFCEQILIARDIQLLIDDSGKYWSGLTSNEKKITLQNFKDSKIKVLVTAKALDEGLNVPECDLGIIIGGTSTNRQNIQRMGRILRVQEGKIAKIYNVYCKNTVEEVWLRKRISEAEENAINVIWE